MLARLTKATRNAAAAFRRSFDAAGGSGRWPTAAFMPSQASAALAVRDQLRSKVNYLTTNAPIAAAIVDAWQVNLVGDGPSVRSGHPDRAMRRALEAAWSKFYRKADIEGGDLVSVLNRVVREMVTGGECFVRLLTTPRGELRLQILPVAQIDASINRELPDGGIVVAGIERGPNGEPRAYWVLPASPDSAFPTMVGPARRIPASELCHVFEPRHAGQMRGVSWLAPVATSILELDATQDAAVMKAKISCLMAGFIRNLEGAADADVAGGELSLEPGVLRKLGAHEDITFTPTADFAGINEFLVHMQRTIASGAGIPYEFASGDLSRTNYSSAKYGGEAFKRRCRAVRTSVLVSRLLQPAWERCVTLEVLSGRLYAPGFEIAPEPFFDVAFLFPEWAALDPSKETSADVEALQAGLRSRAEIIAARGRDIEEVDHEIAGDTFVPRATTTAKEIVNA